MGIDEGNLLLIANRHGVERYILTSSSYGCKKNLNASRPSEHPPDRWENVATFR